MSGPQLKILPQFPAQLTVVAPLTSSKSGLSYTIGFGTVGTAIVFLEPIGTPTYGAVALTALFPPASNLGVRAFVTDATQTMTAGIGAIVAGGGANKVPVYSDGTNWRIG